MNEKTKADYEECAKAGLTQAETARKLGVTRSAVSNYAKLNGLKFAKGRNRGVPYKGFESMTAAARSEGVTTSAIIMREKRAREQKKITVNMGKVTVYYGGLSIDENYQIHRAPQMCPTATPIDSSLKRAIRKMKEFFGLGEKND